MLFIAARLDSKRLPNKVLKPIFEVPLLERLIDRLASCFSKSSIVVCTSINSYDDPIQDFCTKKKILCFRGDEKDVMKRFIDAARLYSASTIARITGDNPLTDPDMLSFMFKIHNQNNSEYTYNEDLPVGTRSEIIDVNALNKVHKNLYDPSNSEYMTYMLKRPDKLKILNVPSINENCSRPEISLTVDNLQDFECLNHIYKSFGCVLPSLEKIIDFLDNNPKIKLTINEGNYTIPQDIKYSYKGDYNDQ